MAIPVDDDLAAFDPRLAGLPEDARRALFCLLTAPDLLDGDDCALFAARPDLQALLTADDMDLLFAAIARCLLGAEACRHQAARAAAGLSW